MKTKFGVFTKKRVVLATLVAVITIFAALPLVEGTKSYPIAIVDGNSMSPNLHSGDLVLYAAPSGPIQNGTIIVFVQGGTGVSTLDAFLKPILIHRVVGSGVEPNGMPYYKTKGDNNAQPDPFVTNADNVLGVPVAVVPYAGLPLQFIKTAYGMVALCAFVTLYFLSGIETRVIDEEEKRKLAAVFAKHSLNGQMPVGDFERMKLAIDYYVDMRLETLNDPTMISMVDWLKHGGLRDKWSEKASTCPACGSNAFSVENRDNSFLFCSNCHGTRLVSHKMS